MCKPLCRLFCVARHRVFSTSLEGVFWRTHGALSYWVAFSTCIGAPEYKWALDMLVAYTWLGMQYEKRIELASVVRLLLHVIPFSTHASVIEQCYCCDDMLTLLKLPQTQAGFAPVVTGMHASISLGATSQRIDRDFWSYTLRRTNVERLIKPGICIARLF